ncbi:MAG: O-antigen ligase family protein [Acidobacteria bacterium]|nr:O-antigen ligase family protein [Acidobacteriota bacterium]
MPAGQTGLERSALVVLLLFIAALPISIAASQILLTLSIGLWLGVLIAHRERPRVPRFFWPLLAYALLTLLSVAASLDPAASLADSKEVLLFLVVPVVYRLARGRAASTAATVIVSAGAATAVYGVVQYGILGYDDLQQRPPGFMGHYMTYSGLLMLVLVLAVARLLFDTRDRAWTGLVLPALAVALMTTFTRGAWIGAGVGGTLLLFMKNVRLLAILPILAIILVAVAPAGIAERFDSIFDRRDPTSRDRIAMARAGLKMVADHPLTGVGPDMVQLVYPRYRGPDAVNEINPHLHNVPLQIAAERGLPALAVWIWFVVATIRELVARFRQPASRALAAAGLAAVVSMLTAGAFEYNFGDSEFLMLLLVLLTLPSAVAAQRIQPQPDTPG